MGRGGLLNEDRPGWLRPGTPGDVSRRSRNEDAWDRASLGLVKGLSDSEMAGVD